jgi:hypothetical protein
VKNNKKMLDLFKDVCNDKHEGNEIDEDKLK